MIALAIICAIVGLAGAIVPGLPGPPIAWLALLFIHLSDAADYSPAFLIILGAIALIITVLDYVVPVWGTKRLGGTKAGSWGSTIGLLASMFVFPAVGIVIGPLGLVSMLAGPCLGAWIGEQLFGNKDNALRSAWGSFLGFLAGTLMKLAYGSIVVVFVIKDWIW